MTTITNLEAKTYNNKPSGFKITLSDGRTGNLNEKESDKGLRIGDPVIVTEIPYTSKEGKHSTLYGVRLAQGVQQSSHPQPSSHPSSPVKVPLSGSEIKIHKVEASIKALRFVIDAYNADKVQWNEIATKQKECTNILFADIDDIYAEK